MKDIHDKFDKAEVVVERTGKLILKVVTVIVGVLIALVVALEQLDYHILSDDPEEYHEENSFEDQKEFIQEEFIDQQFQEYNKK